MITRSNHILKTFYQKVFSLFFNAFSKTKSSYKEEFSETGKNSIEYNVFLSQMVIAFSIIIIAFTFIPFLIVFFVLQFLGFSFLAWFLPFSVIWVFTSMAFIGLFKSENAKRFKKKHDTEKTGKDLPVKAFYRMNDLDLVIALIVGMTISFLSNITYL